MTKNILIAEDDQFLSKMYRLNVKDTDWKVTLVENGESAIAAINKQPPDLMLLDIMMPQTDGIGVLQYVREEGHNFPVIILTNLSQETDKQKCMELGAVDYYVKSDMDLDELNELIRKYL